MVTGVLRARVDLDPRVLGTINATIAALDAAGLDEAFAALRTRLIERPTRLVRIRSGDDKMTLVAELSPFAELLLLEVRDLARRPGDVATKTRWIDQALSLGGV